MAEKPPAFTVTDRRKFTTEGDLREESTSTAETAPPPPAQPSGEFNTNIADAVHPAPGQFGARVADAVHPAPGQFGANIAEAVHPAPGQFGARVAEAAAPSPIADAVHPAPGQFGARVAEAVHPAPGQFGGRVVTMPAPASSAPPAPQAAAVTPAPAAAPPQEPHQDMDDAGEEGETLPEPTAAESAEQQAAYRETSQGLDDLIRQSNPGSPAMGPVTIEHVIQSIYLSAVVAMGAATEPGQKPRIDILGARQSIDMLTVLQEKTAGNLSEKEQRLLQNMLFELRMMFLEITNAIANQAHNPPLGKK